LRPRISGGTDLKTAGLVSAIVSITAVAYLFFWPVDIDPLPWDPPVISARTDLISAEENLAVIADVIMPAAQGPEDVAVDSTGRIYVGVSDGRILRANPDGSSMAVFANTSGRPLGLAFDPTGHLIVADALKGLLSLSPDGQIRTLATSSNGVSFRFTNDADVADDGTIYFSDASDKHGPASFYESIIEHRPRGRLLSYDSRSSQVESLLDGLHFANGVALSPDQTFVLVAETGAYRIKRYWLAGPKAGKVDVFIDNLPGFPDGISSNRRDKFWLALYAPRSAVLDSLKPYPFLLKVLMRLPDFALPTPPRRGIIIGLSVDGRILHYSQAPSGGYAPISSVEEHEGWLYLGSLLERGVGRVPVPMVVNGQLK